MASEHSSSIGYNPWTLITAIQQNRRFMNPTDEPEKLDDNSHRLVWERLLSIKDESLGRIAARLRRNRVPGQAAKEIAWDLFLDRAQYFLVKADGFIASDDPLAYLLKACWHRYLDQRKDAKRSLWGDWSEVGQACPVYLDNVIDTLDAERAYSLLEGKLNQRDFSMLRMDAEGYTDREIGAAHGLIPVSTRTALHKARRRAMKALKRRRLF